MKITSTEEYGLRCLMLLARTEDRDPLTITDIAEREGLSLPHVGKIMGILKEAGLVDSVRGRSGGYVLKYPAGELNLSRVFRALDGRLLDLNYCHKVYRNSAPCVHIQGCSLQSFWESLTSRMDQFLGQVTVADLMGDRFLDPQHGGQGGQPSEPILVAGLSGGNEVETLKSAENSQSKESYR